MFGMLLLHFEVILILIGDFKSENMHNMICVHTEMMDIVV